MDRTPTTSDQVTPQILDQTEIAVIGFPRSGSTFLAFAFGHSLDEDSVLKLHDVRAIPQLSASNVKIFVPLRNPIDTSVSWSLYNHDELSKTLALSRLKTYLAWHRILLRKRKYPGVNIVSFDQFTEDLDPLLSAMPELGAPDSPTASLAADQLRIELANQQAIQDVDLMSRNTPTKERDRLATSYRELYQALEGHRIMKKCNAAFEELSSYIDVQPC